jgi:hypothetical protein
VTGVPEPAGPSASPSDEPAPELGPTGHAGVDAALAELDAVSDADPAQQVAAYEQAHRALSQTLAAIDQN